MGRSVEAGFVAGHRGPAEPTHPFPHDPQCHRRLITRDQRQPGVCPASSSFIPQSKKKTQKRAAALTPKLVRVDLSPRKPRLASRGARHNPPIGSAELAAGGVRPGRRRAESVGVEQGAADGDHAALADRLHAERGRGLQRRPCLACAHPSPRSQSTTSPLGAAQKNTRRQRPINREHPINHKRFGAAQQNTGTGQCTAAYRRRCCWRGRASGGCRSGR